MKKLNMQSLDVVVSNVEKIAHLFPNCVTERLNKDGKPELAIDFEKLQAELCNDIIAGSEERYQFTWPDKRAAARLANTPTTMTLRPCREESVDFDNTQNLYIEGDNLDVLKVLRETYLGKVKMIYIDPPYNTGHDFVYNDDFAESYEEFAKSCKAYDEEGNLQFNPKENGESNGRFHTDWLNMMYPRLKVARDLLSEDGFIFISIDDNEVHNLKKICDEVFGSHNYMNQFAWVSNITGRQISGRGAAKTWESVLVYCKNIADSYGLNVDISFAKEKMPDSYKGFNKDIRTDSRGAFAVGDTLYNHNRKFNEETRPNLVFSIFYNPETEEIITGDIGEVKSGFVELPPHENGDGIHKYHAWRWSKQKIANECYDLIVLNTSRGGYEIYTRIREFDNTLLKDIITNISNGYSEVQKLFDDKKYFDYPKSVDLLRTFIGAIRNKDSIIIDFFSGSGTTAHAVMRLNAEDGGNRKFIMVQLPEKTDEKSEAFKDGYYNICEIGKERIRRAGKKVKEEAGLQGQNLDIGFRVLKLDSSNMADVYYTPQESGQQTLFDENVKPDRSNEDLLFQVMLDLGIELSAKIEVKQIAGKTVHFVDGNYLVACFDSEVNESTITEIARLQPVYFVMRDASAASDNVIDNFEQIFKHYSPDTNCRII
ncbi:MAG: site-specific DNA-methyltransferase [Akkermansia sp.]|nr:site-specific DNA-methyltransferase [Akkermansia sp.]